MCPNHVQSSDKEYIENFWTEQYMIFSHLNLKDFHEILDFLSQKY